MLRPAPNNSTATSNQRLGPCNTGERDAAKREQEQAREEVVNVVRAHVQIGVGELVQPEPQADERQHERVKNEPEPARVEFE